MAAKCVTWNVYEINRRTFFYYRVLLSFMRVMIAYIESTFPQLQPIDQCVYSEHFAMLTSAFN